MCESKIERKLSCKGRCVCVFLHPYVEVCLCLRAEHRARAGNEVVVPPVRGNRMADTLLKSQTGRTSESQS